MKLNLSWSANPTNLPTKHPFGISEAKFYSFFCEYLPVDHALMLKNLFSESNFRNRFIFNLTADDALTQNVTVGHGRDCAQL